jgi:prophage regulatory protein
MTYLSDKLLRISDVSERLRISKSTIYKWVKDGRFPEPIILGDGASRWVEGEINEWLENRPRGVQGD